MGAAAAPACAQSGGTRVVEEHPFDDPEGLLMGYYSAVVAFSPLGAAAKAKAWTIDLDVETGFIPPLSEDQRTAGRDKPEATNLAPAYFRPRAAIVFPANIRLELGWLPPLELFGVTPNVGSVALSAPVAHIRAVEIVPRATYTWGTIKAPITCNSDLASSPNQSFQIYYQLVCHDRESDDHFEPSQWSGEIDGSAAIMGGALVPYAGIGVQHYDTKFDIGVINPDGSRDTDHPILHMEAYRGFGVAGVTWLAASPLSFSGELYWAPGSLFTARFLARVALHSK